jgi:hypothetical protein
VLYLEILSDSRGLEIGQGLRSNKFELKVWNILKLIQNSNQGI